MRDYLSEDNLLKAAGLAIVMTLMSVLRIVEGGFSLWLYVPAALVSMTLVCGAITAWSGQGGLPGFLPETRTLWRGVALGAVLAAVLTPIYVLWLDPVLHGALAEVLSGHALALQYPATVRARLALLLWSAGFQTAFFCAAPMCLFSRLTGNRWAALVLTVGLRALLLMSRQSSESAVSSFVPVFYVSVIATGVLSCLLFARFGLPAVMVFSAGLDLRLLLFAARQ